MDGLVLQRLATQSNHKSAARYQPPSVHIQLQRALLQAASPKRPSARCFSRALTLDVVLCTGCDCIADIPAPVARFLPDRIETTKKVEIGVITTLWAMRMSVMDIQTAS